MTSSPFGSPRVRLACAFALAAALAGLGSARPSAQAAGKAGPAQKLDADYTAKIKAATADPRILTELVDHLPASDKVPSPLKFLGYIPGEPGKLTYHKDIVRYMEALDKASDRVKMLKIGESEEGRDMVALAIADEATIKNLDKYKQITAQLTDPRKLNDAQAKQLIATGKPIYYAMGSIHSPEIGSPEMLMELAYRLAVEESPFIQTIRNNAIVVLTPASEVDGREKQVDNFRAQAAGQPSPSMVYWGKYVQHDNNRDGIGVGLRLTQVMLKTFLDWHPTVLHDLHESVTLLYTSTGTGPYNAVVDPIQVNEWWLLAQTEIMEMTKRDVPGVWTYNYYDGWVPNYMFWIGVTHNSIGRFYETQSYGGAVNRPLPVTQSREWYRPNPTPPDMTVGSAQQRQHAAERAADRDELRREEQGNVPRELLPEEQAHHRARPGQGAVCLRDSGGAAAQGRGGGADEPDPPRGRRSPRRQRRVHARHRPGRAGRLHRPPRSAVWRRSSRRCSGCSSTRRRTRGRTTTPAGRSRCVRNVKTYRGRRQVGVRQADDAVGGGLQGRRGDCRHRPDADRRSHHRQHARHVPLPAQGREDGGGGEGVRGRRAQVRAGVVRDRRTRTAPRSSRRSRSSACRRGPSTRRRACRCTTSTCRGSATSTPGRAPRTKAGSAWRSTTSRFPTPTSRAPKLREGNLQVEVRRDRLPARRPGRHRA